MGDVNKRTARIPVTSEELQQILQEALFSRGVQGQLTRVDSRLVAGDGDLFPVPDGIVLTVELDPLRLLIIEHLEHNPEQTAREVAAALHRNEKLVMRLLSTMLEMGEVKTRHKQSYRTRSNGNVQANGMERVYSLQDGDGSGLQDILKVRWTV